MTIAEEMAIEWGDLGDNPKEWIDACRTGDEKFFLMNLIKHVAVRSREEAIKALSQSEPNREYPTYIQEDEAKFHILDNKWEEEEA